jgi:hypothetical protein
MSIISVQGALTFLFFFRPIAMIHFQTRLDHILLSSTLLLTLMSSGNALPQVADYPPPVVARPPGRVVQKPSGSFSWVKFINEHSLFLAVAGVGTSLLTDPELGLIYSAVLGVLTCLCCMCCCCGRGSHIRNGGESDHELERKHVSAQRQFFYTAFAPFRRRFGRSDGLRNGRDNGFCCC